jgi:outer membrane protein assembly factor BamB
VAAPTPASDGRFVYALFSSNDLFCLDLEGNLVWLRGLTLDYPNVSNSLGMSSSVAVAEGVVLAQVENDSESYALGLDAATGVNRWKLERPKLANWTSPVVFRGASGQTWFALQSGKGVAGVEPATGRVSWNYPQGASTIPSSAVSGDTLYVPSFGITAIRPEPGQTNVTQAWRSGPLRPGTASPAVAGNRLYVLNDAGVLNCGELATGQRLWQLRLKGPFSASPVVAQNRLLAVNEKGLLQVVDLAGAEGTVAAEKDLGHTILSTPSLAGRAIYLRSDSTLWKWGRR